MSETENCRPFRGRVIVTLGVLVASVAVANFSTVSIQLGNGDGTVAAAVEATLRGVPSIAISLDRSGLPDFAPAARLARSLAAEALSRGSGAIPGGALLNVNCPAGALEGYQVTFLGRRVYRDQVEARRDLRGRYYYWIGGPEENATDLPGSDCSAVRAGWASVSSRPT